MSPLCAGVELAVASARAALAPRAFAARAFAIASAFITRFDPPDQTVPARPLLTPPDQFVRFADRRLRVRRAHGLRAAHHEGGLSVVACGDCSGFLVLGVIRPFGQGSRH